MKLSGAPARGACLAWVFEVPGLVWWTVFSRGSLSSKHGFCHRKRSLTSHLRHTFDLSQLLMPGPLVTPFGLFLCRKAAALKENANLVQFRARFDRKVSEAWWRARAKLRARTLCVS